MGKGCAGAFQNFEQNTHARRCFRLCSFLVVLLLFYLFLVAFNFHFVRRVPVEYTYGDRTLAIKIFFKSRYTSLT